MHLRIEKDRGKKVENRVAPFVTGFGHLPESGGVLDQGVWMMAILESFKNGENATAAKRLK